MACWCNYYFYSFCVLYQQREEKTKLNDLHIDQIMILCTVHMVHVQITHVTFSLLYFRKIEHNLLVIRTTKRKSIENHSNIRLFCSIFFFACQHIQITIIEEKKKTKININKYTKWKW